MATRSCPGDVPEPGLRYMSDVRHRPQCLR
ncbi:hypothetical protein PARU111607_05075 [Palleronia rufa]